MILALDDTTPIEAPQHDNLIVWIVIGSAVVSAFVLVVVIIYCVCRNRRTHPGRTEGPLTVAFTSQHGLVPPQPPVLVENQHRNFIDIASRDILPTDGVICPGGGDGYAVPLTGYAAPPGGYSALPGGYGVPQTYISATSYGVLRGDSTVPPGEYTALLCGCGDPLQGFDGYNIQSADYNTPTLISPIYSHQAPSASKGVVASVGGVVIDFVMMMYLTVVRVCAAAFNWLFSHVYA